jgi:hypothetical protein
MDNRDKLTHLMKKAAPFIANVSGDVNEETVDQDIQAVLMALETHKQGTDHEQYDHAWDGVNTFNKETYFKGPIGLDSDQLVLNHDGSDADVELQFFRTTGGPFSIFWNGILAWTTKPFRPAELIISRISATPPEATFAGMVWVDPSD